MTAYSPTARIDTALDAIQDRIVTVSPRIAATSKAHTDRIRLHDALTAVTSILNDHDDDIETEHNLEYLLMIDEIRGAIAARLEADVEPTIEYGDITL